MKTQKAFLALATVSLLGLNVACSDRYDEGFAAGKTAGYTQGYDQGYDDGYLDGDEAGYARAAAYFSTADYNAGFNAGKTEGIQIGYSQGQTAGYNSGYTAGQTTGYNTGYTAGSSAGYSNGYDDGYDDGILDGYDMGYDDGILDGYDLGYDDGFLDGYDVGYDDGYDDGYYGLSVGKTAKLQGYANLLSMAHNDLINYSKISAPKQTARGVVVNGKLLFEETSLTGKDTLKRAAVVEQYLVVEMSKQIKSLGLSSERSLQIAKAANHFRKQASKNALTNEDTAAYVTEIVGSDLKTLEAAHESGDMSEVLKAAASKNGVSPEKMALILAKNFL